MSEPDIDELESAAEEIVEDAYDNGKLNELTCNSVRRQLEKKFKLKASLLDGPDYKPLINDAVRRATSRCDDDLDIPNSPVKKSAAKSEKKTKEPKKRKEMVYKSAEFIPTSESENEGESSSSKKAGGSATKPKLESSKAANKDADEVNDSSADEAPQPKKRRISKENAGKKTAKETKSRKKSTAATDKDEEKIKRLKALVAACGIRKVWAKVFQDAPKPSQQIAILKRILGELGMTGRMSMEQAKAIREKRELQQELEDVQTFEKSINRQASRLRTKAERNQDAESEAGDSPSEDEEVVVTKRKATARQRIDAFLDSDSD